jgi:hypothetical protein
MVQMEKECKHAVAFSFGSSTGRGGKAALWCMTHAWRTCVFCTRRLPTVTRPLVACCHLGVPCDVIPPTTAWCFHGSRISQDASSQKARELLRRFLFVSTSTKHYALHHETCVTSPQPWRCTFNSRLTCHCLPLCAHPCIEHNALLCHTGTTGQAARIGKGGGEDLDAMEAEQLHSWH